MSDTIKTSDPDYCETCGTMIVAGICRRCDPDHTVNVSDYVSHSNKYDVVQTTT